MPDRNDGFTDAQMLLMHQLYELVDDALYADALQALATVLGELLCAGAPSQAVALEVASKTGDNLVRLVELHYDEINDPVAGGVTLQ